MCQQRPATMETIIFPSRETSIRRALILTLGAYQARTSSVEDAVTAEQQADRDVPRRSRCRHPRRGRMDLAQWKQQEKLKAADAELKRSGDRGDRRWFVNSQGQTFAVIDGPAEFQMGSPDTEPERNAATSFRIESPLPGDLRLPQRSDRRTIPALREKRQQRSSTMAESLKPYTSFPDGPATRLDLVCGRRLLQLAEQAGRFRRGPVVLRSQQRAAATKKA